jgi:hypothetical protein
LNTIGAATTIGRRNFQENKEKHTIKSLASIMKLSLNQLSLLRHPLSTVDPPMIVDRTGRFAARPAAGDSAYHADAIFLPPPKQRPKLALA